MKAVHALLRSVFPPFFAMAVAVSSTGARADGMVGPIWGSSGSLILGQPSAIGGELALSAQFQPSAEHELYVGPRIGALLAFAENSTTRFDLNWGLSEVLWVVNAVGAGVDLDIVAPSAITGQDAQVHYRVTPALSIRLLHWGEQGAWAVRLGVPYDTHYKWGVQAGVSLQFNGVPGIGNF